MIEMLYGYKYINNKPRTYCKCLGVDNEEYIIRADALRSGATTSIKGATKSGTKQDITGMKFGHLTALYPTDKRAANCSVIWVFRCDCGNIVEATMSNAKRGHTRSCGCNRRSKYEELIHDYLTSLNVDFVEEKRFSDCTNLQGSDTLPFDFYIPNKNKIIEFDGQHHFEIIPGWGGEDKFKKTKENDNIKNNYCLKNDIELLRLPYTLTEDEIIEKVNCFINP